MELLTITEPVEGLKATMLLSLEVADTEVAAELEKYSDGLERQGFALGALRVGVLAVRQARGELDASTLRQAGQEVLGGLESLFAKRGAEITAGIAGTLRQYFDPGTGALPQRIESLLKQDGELERALRQHVGPGSSTITRTLEGQLIPLLKFLSPDEAEGVKARIESMLNEAFKEQQRGILKEFSLDSHDSCLARLVKRVQESNSDLTVGIKGHVDTLIGEFSLDKADSALSRLVTKVENAQKLIGTSLTLDDESSPLSRLKRELKATIDDVARGNISFQAEIRETLAKLQTRREVAAGSTLHGNTFEQQVGELLDSEAQRLNDIHECTGATTGAITYCKIGDFVTTLGPDCVGSGARIVWEAKSNKSYDVAGARKELEQARKNRQAQVGVFVFSKQAAPDGTEPFARYGNDLVVFWDADDRATDLFVRAAYSVARALVVRESHRSAGTEATVEVIEIATRAIERQIQYITQIITWAETVRKNGEEIGERAGKMRSALQKQVDELDIQLLALKTSRLQA
jgi:hypothetical protein